MDDAIFESVTMVAPVASGTNANRQAVSSPSFNAIVALMMCLAHSVALSWLPTLAVPAIQFVAASTAAGPVTGSATAIAGSLAW